MTFLEHLIAADLRPLILDTVHAANMRKVAPPQQRDPATGKILKPKGWTPPAIDACLWDQGWRP